MKKVLKLSFFLSMLLFCVGCDQATKSVAKKLLSSSDTSLFSGFIRFEYVENPGGFLSIGAELPSDIRFLIFVVFAGAMLALMPLLVINERNIKLTQLMGLALVIGGGIGNLIDRIINNGRVVDFVSLGIESFRTGIFNTADIAVIAGAALLLTGLVRNKESPIESA